MSQHLIQRHSVAWILCKQLGNQVFRLPCHGRRELWIAHLDLPVGSLLALVLKRRLPNHELIEQDAESPNIDPAVVLFVDNHLWRKVVQSSAERFTPRGRSMNCPAEVCNLQSILQANENVLRLDVSVDDMLRVAVLNGLNHLFEVPCRPCLREGTATLQQSIELPTGCHLKAEVDPLLVMEEGVESQNVHMPTVRLNLDLSPELMLNSVLDKLSLI
mmetsp:Transcript_3807/g.4728  ORF Transcript_3807/g.4728 Transcript_3807/m.4728 type:complete len:217 (-) Transcript_3807:371-1021(-)